MKKNVFLLMITISLISCGGGGGGDDSGGSGGASGSFSNCEFDLSEFSNGTSTRTASSYWACTDEYSSYNFQFYLDGTGYSTGVGAFTWTQTACNEVDITYAGGDSDIVNITGSTDSGIATFTQKTELHSSCVLVSTSSSSEPVANEAVEDESTTTDVYNYYENEPYVVYVDTSLYLGDYQIGIDDCSFNVWAGSVSDTMTIDSLSNHIMQVSSDAFSASLYLDEDFPHFDGSDGLNYWLVDGDFLCTSSVGSLPANNGYTDILIIVCGFVGYDSCGMTYRRTNPTAVKSTSGLFDVHYNEAVEDMLNRIQSNFDSKIEELESQNK